MCNLPDGIRAVVDGFIVFDSAWADKPTTPGAISANRAYCSTYSMVDASEVVKDVLTQRPASSNHWSMIRSPV